MSSDEPLADVARLPRALAFVDRWASWVCVCLLLSSLIDRLPWLGRFPLPTSDDTLFAYPAIQFLQGHGLVWRISHAAPGGDAIFAYHGPFLPRLNVLTFGLFGPSLFLARLPQLLAAHLAIALLCGFLIRSRRRIPALILAVWWLGDRASQEVVLGRPDGIAFLCLVASFMLALKAIQRDVPWACVWAIVALGLGAAFHPVVLCFGPAIGLALALGCSPTSRLRFLVAVLVSAPLAVLPIFLCWLPHPGVALEQFRWYLHLSTYFADPLVNSEYQSRVMRWAWMWIPMLYALTALVLIPRAIQLWLRRAEQPDTDQRFLAVALAALSVTGIGILLRGPGVPYYLVYFTVWPILGWLLALADGRSLLPRAASWLVALAVVVAWIPGFAWNAFRLREIPILGTAADPSAFREQLRLSIPNGARISISTELFWLTSGTDRPARPLPFVDSAQAAPPDEWIVLTQLDWERSLRRLPKQHNLRRRRVAHSGGIFPANKYLNTGFVVLAPISIAPSADTP